MGDRLAMARECPLATKRVLVGKISLIALELKLNWILGRNTLGKDDFTYIPPVYVNRKPVVHVRSDQFKEMESKYANLLVGSFIGKMPTYNFVKDILQRDWKNKEFSMKPYGNCSYTFEFINEDDRRKALDTEIDPKCTYPEDVSIVLDERKAIQVQLEYNWKPPRKQVWLREEDKHTDLVEESLTQQPLALVEENQVQGVVQNIGKCIQEENTTAMAEQQSCVKKNCEGSTSTM
ncbi:hypothetical protein FRX31_029027 [Thalictrum thalictroides]|uniref:Uncharacterized protein n=1 Tax=Thalictrum thalictroides TaxID=46969 RepID=A0A7J6V8K8_THATH|nr:hypothetical protein FRX31_029027 [Thalictrum thalictroides]